MDFRKLLVVTSAILRTPRSGRLASRLTVAMQNALALTDPKERPLKVAERPASAANRKPPFWSSKVHGIPQTYAGSSRPAGEPSALTA